MVCPCRCGYRPRDRAPHKPLFPVPHNLGAFADSEYPRHADCDAEAREGFCPRPAPIYPARRTHADQAPSVAALIPLATVHLNTLATALQTPDHSYTD